MSSPLFDLTGRVYVVTGSAGPLAGSAAAYLAAQGASVAYLGRSREKLDVAFGRFGEAEELHGAVHYLLADASKFVTGATLVVDGGFSVFSGV